jgi:hypothetical protein
MLGRLGIGLTPIIVEGILVASSEGIIDSGNWKNDAVSMENEWDSWEIGTA